MSTFNYIIKQKIYNIKKTSRNDAIAIAIWQHVVQVDKTLTSLINRTSYSASSIVLLDRETLKSLSH